MTRDKRKWRFSTCQFNLVIFYTFTEFVNFITSSLNNQAIDNMDIHWKPVSRICNPCAVRYDVVIDHDNVSDESITDASRLSSNKQTNQSSVVFRTISKKSNM